MGGSIYQYCRVQIYHPYKQKMNETVSSQDCSFSDQVIPDKFKSMCEDDDVVSLIKIWNVIQRIIEFEII